MRDSSLARVLLLLLEHGGLTYTGESHPHESCLNLEIGIAAKKVKKASQTPSREPSFSRRGKRWNARSMKSALNGETSSMTI